MQLLTAFAFGIFVYMLFLAFEALLMRRKKAVYERLKDLKEVQSAAPSSDMPAKKRAKKRKSGSETLARTRKQLEKLENQIYDVGIRMPAQKFLAVWFSGTIILVLLETLAGLPAAASAGTVAACALGPVMYIRIRKSRRRAALDGQLVEAISILCNALRAGHSFQGAMSSISNEMSGVVSEEFGRVFRETQHGISLEESLGKMVERTGSSDLEMLCTAILIQRDVGGNLAEVLENISGTIQARLALKAEIKTRTASGRLSGYMIGALPVILLLAMNAINPEYCSMLFTTKPGHIMLIVGACMELLGLLVIMKMVSIKY